MILEIQKLFIELRNIVLNPKDLMILCYENYYIIFSLLSALKPMLYLLLLPGLIVLIFYLMLFIICLYQLKNFFLDRSRKDYSTATSSLRWLLCCFWCVKGKLMHGYEIHGLEKIPVNESAYIVYYHGTIPLDIYYFATNFIIQRKKIPVPVVDRFLFHVPGFRTLLDFMRCTPGTVDGCVKQLTDTDDVLLISPGGVREAVFSDEYYNTLWGKRRGFAKIALKANKPVYPLFTENIREPVRVVQFGKSWWMKLYEKTRIPIAIFYGYFPCKLRTYIGDPVYPLKDEDEESFADRVNKSLEQLILEKQILPGNIVRSVFQRIPIFDRWLHHRYDFRRKSKLKTHCHTS